MGVDLNFLSRKKVFTAETLVSSKLNRVLDLFDVFSIGMGFTLGAGIYILAGTVIRDYSGPATLVSFIIAGIGTFFSGLSYAELGSRVPRSGSAFVYIYVTIGEFFAFVMGWDLILEYMIGTAGNANALSGYINALAGDRIKNFLASLTPMNVPELASYVDFFAFILTMVITGLLIIGVKESSFLNKIFTFVNILALVFMIIAGATRSDPRNWSIDIKNATSWVENNVTMTCESSTRCGSGGFLPFGINGLIGGSAKCFYAFIGFDAIASTGEELHNPRRNIPLSIFLTVFITLVIYCGLSIVLTFMVPFYLMDVNIPLTFAFEYVDLNWCQYVASVGAIFSLSTCLYSGMYPMPRIVYTMASDGLLFKPFGKVLPKIKTPWVATLITGIISGILAAIFDLSQLVDMLSIGTLMAYTFVSICVLVLRYRPDEYNDMIKEKDQENHLNRFRKSESLLKLVFKTLFNPDEDKPTLFTTRLANILILLSIIHIIVIVILVSIVKLTQVYLYVIVTILLFNLLVMSISIFRQPVNIPKAAFITPFLPFLPFASIFVNIYMLTTLSLATWLRFIIWFVIGLVIYFGYGKRNSLENPNRPNQQGCLCFSWFKKTKRPQPLELSQANGRSNAILMKNLEQ